MGTNKTIDDGIIAIELKLAALIYTVTIIRNQALKLYFIALENIMYPIY